MNTPSIKQPADCTRQERQEFARLVRQGFAGSDDSLPDRIRDAKRLAFYYAADGTLAAIGALKAPTDRYREEIFKKADAPVSSDDYELELGWVFVVTGNRGHGIGARLCQLLLARVPTSRVFATTRPNNTPMIRILRALTFERTGEPYPHARRNEHLVLFLRSSAESTRYDDSPVAPAPPPSGVRTRVMKALLGSGT